jgi:GTP-binding protein
LTDLPKSPLASLPVEFIGSFPDPAHRLEPAAAEFAFIGRSNVGKSSLLNALVGRRALARVSGTPGKTQLLNVYRLPTFYLIDLPGYGFAQANKTARLEYRALLEALLKTRTSLTGVVWLLDVRHPLSADDEDFQTLLANAGRPVLAVLTKADKIVQSKRVPTVAARARELGLGPAEVQLVSAVTGLGISDLGESLLAAANAKGDA